MKETVALDACLSRAAHPAGQREPATRSLPRRADILAHAELFKLLGDSTRLGLLYALLRTEEVCVRDLAEATAMSETSASHALRLLRTSGVVSGHRRGRHVYYCLADSRVRAMLELSSAATSG